MYPRYEEIRKRIHKVLQEKTSWGRVQLATRIDEILIQTADDELADQEPQTGSEQLEIPPPKSIPW